MAGTGHRRRRHCRLRPGRLAIGCVTGLLRECEHCGVNNRDDDVSARGLAGRGRQRRSCGAGAQPQGGGPLRPRRRVGVGVVGSDIGSSGVGPHHVWVINHNSLIFYGATGAQLATDSYSATNFSSGPVFTADGSTWAWAWSPQQNQQGGGTTTIYMGTQASQMRAMVTHADPLGPTSHSRRVDSGWHRLPHRGNGHRRWSHRLPRPGDRLVAEPHHRGPFGAERDVCHLQDVLPDGSLLCLQGSSLTIARPPTTLTTLPLTGGFEQYGDARYSARSNSVLVSAVSFEPSTTSATYLTWPRRGERTADVLRCLRGLLPARWTPSRAAVDWLGRHQPWWHGLRAHPSRGQHCGGRHRFAPGLTSWTMSQ